MHDEHAADEERQRAARPGDAARDEEIRALAARLGSDRALAARLASWRAGCPRRTPRRTGRGRRGRRARRRRGRRPTDRGAHRAGRGRRGRRRGRARPRRAAGGRPARPPRRRRARRPRLPAARTRRLAGHGCGNWPTRPPRPEARAAGLPGPGPRRRRGPPGRPARRRRRPPHRPRAARRARRDRRRPRRRCPRTPATARTRRRVPARPARGVPRRLPALREGRRRRRPARRTGPRRERRERRAWPSWTGSATRSAPAPPSSCECPTAPTAPPGRPPPPAPRRWSSSWRPACRRASEQLGRLRGEAERLAPEEGDAHTELPEDLVPRDADQAQALLRTATTELASAHRGAGHRPAPPTPNCCGAHRAAEDAAGGFDETAALLRDLLREHRRPTRSRTSPSRTRAAWRRPGSPPPRPAARCAAAPPTCPPPRPPSARRATSWSGTPTPPATSRSAPRPGSRSANCPPPRCPSTRPAWADAFAPRLRVLTDELAQLERNRDSIVDRLRGLVESALATLRSAQRLSRLPEGLGEWSGQEFLRIRFEEPDQATLTERLGEVIDEATRAAVKKNSDLRRDGMSLLLRGRRRPPCSPRASPWRSSSRTRCCAPSASRSGRWATSSPAASCSPPPSPCTARWPRCAATTGAATGTGTRARCSSTTPSAAPTPPTCWSSSAPSSDALGVQLLYTTGLFDTTALAEFPLVIRLRNDADLRAGLKYISVEEHLRPGPAPAGPPRRARRCTARSPRPGCSAAAGGDRAVSASTPAAPG